jgi:hypothetical protein
MEEERQRHCGNAHCSLGRGEWEVETGLVSYPFQPDDCPADFRLSQLRFGIKSVWGAQGVRLHFQKRAIVSCCQRGKERKRRGERKKKKRTKGGKEESKEGKSRPPDASGTLYPSCSSALYSCIFDLRGGI